jgi:myo-inositol-1(or 4)-monophosphatase
MNDYLQFAQSLAREAGDIMRRYFLTVERTWKQDDTPLTKADTEINDLVITRIHEKYPDHSIHGEEKSDYRESKYLWVCDPVDGTLPYSSGIAASTFSLALVIDGVSTVGAVYDPFNDRLFFAEKGKGAFVNETPLHVSDQSTLENAVIDIEGLHSYGFESEIPLSNAFRDVLLDKGVKTTQFWSSILPSVLVARGTFTAVIMNGQTVQDGAAIKVIVDEAGGKVTDMYGNDQRYDEPARGFIASNGLVHDELVRLIEKNRVVVL